MREWVVKYNQYKKSFKRLEDACWYIACKLDSIRALPLMTKGIYSITYFVLKNEYFCKRYVVTVDIPCTTMTLIKKSKGDLNIDEVNDTLKYVQNIYYERNKC